MLVAEVGGVGPAPDDVGDVVVAAEPQRLVVVEHLPPAVRMNAGRERHLEPPPVSVPAAERLELRDEDPIAGKQEGVVEVVPPGVAGEVDEVEGVPAEVAAKPGTSEEAAPRVLARGDDVTGVGLDPDAAVGVDAALSGAQVGRGDRPDRADLDGQVGFLERAARRPRPQQQTSRPRPQPDALGPEPGVMAAVGLDHLLEQSPSISARLPQMSDRLQRYRSKRTGKSGEPAGEVTRAGKRRGNRFVIQKHDARRLHYDFRLEVDGTLRSWAVPKGPSTDPREKRLAVEVEDHPLDYVDFEGTIGAGNYGAGAVIVWDRGTYTNLDESRDMATSIEAGHVKFWLEGEKLRGGWTLQRTHGGEKPQWLLIKRRDEDADARRNPVSTQPESVQSGRTIEEVAAEEDGLVSPASAGGGRPRPPRRGTGADPRQADEGRAHRPTASATRAGSSSASSTASAASRSATAATSGCSRATTCRSTAATRRSPRRSPATAASGSSLDGEVVAFDGSQTSFALLARRKQRVVPVFYYVFDLLWLDGLDVRRLPLRSRKRLLRHRDRLATTRSG